MISIILTSQKFTLVPSAIRSNLTFIMFFRLNKIDMKLINEQIIFHNSDFDDVMNYIFDDTEDDIFAYYRIDKNLYFKKFSQLLI